MQQAVLFKWILLGYESYYTYVMFLYSAFSPYTVTVNALNNVLACSVLFFSTILASRNILEHKTQFFSPYVFMVSPIPEVNFICSVYNNFHNMPKISIASGTLKARPRIHPNLQRFM